MTRARPDEAEDLLATAWETGERLDDVEVRLRVLDARARLLVGRGRFREGEDAARQGLRLAADRGSAVLILDYLLGTRCDALMAIGEWARAASALEDALLVDRPNLERGGLYARLAAVRCAVGDLDAARTATETARSRLEAGTADPSLLVLIATVEAELASAEGRPTVAADVARQAVAEHADHVASADMWRLLQVAAAAVTAASRPAGREPPAWLVAAVQAQGVRAPESSWNPVVAAELAGSDPELWRHAASASGDDSIPVLVRLQVRHRAAESLLAVGARTEAARLLGDLISSAERLGARGIHQAALDLSLRARLKVAGSDGHGAVHGAVHRAGVGELTPRELEVLRLLTAGRSNAAIASRLVISSKTVSVHVSHILDKLGAASRGEAAAIARLQGLADPEA